MDTTIELDRIKKAFSNLPVRDTANKDRLMMELETVVRYALPSDAERFVKEARRIPFFPIAFIAGGPDHTPRTWEEGKRAMLALIESIQHAVKFAEPPKRRADSTKPSPTKRIFIVHGHDKAMLNAVEAYTARIGLEPVVLTEEPHRGRTLIEKFEHYSDVNYAVVLLSPDDVGRAASDSSEKERPRPRQNAVLELGYFIGRLGRDHVAAIVDATKPNAEYPSDINGVAYIPFDASHNEWRLLLIREYRAAGLPLDETKA